MTKLNNINEILSSIQKNLKAPKDKTNNFGKFSYRNAEGILEAYKTEVSKDNYPEGLTLRHNFEIQAIHGRVFAICTSILETADCKTKEANGFAEIDVSKKGMDQSQLSGAVMSYAKKYSLCNLFAIDDSKDDPDSDEKSHQQNAFGISQNLVNDLDDDKKEMHRMKNEEEFDVVKLAIMGCGSVEELEAAWQDKKKEIASLKKYAPDLYSGLVSIAATEKQNLQE